VHGNAEAQGRKEDAREVQGGCKETRRMQEGSKGDARKTQGRGERKDTEDARTRRTQGRGGRKDARKMQGGLITSASSTIY
jgi:hypothetical protein